MTDIIIDFREKELIYHCQLQNEKIKIDNLHLGDIRIDKLLIERKTINDLAASIVDGRYKEQSARLKKALEEGFQVFYFIEGNIDLYTGSISKNTIVSTIYSLTQKGFQVITTKNSKETVFFIIQFAQKMKKINKEKDLEKEKKEREKELEKDLQQLNIKSQVNEHEVNQVNEVNEINGSNEPQESKECESIVTKKKNTQITRDTISIYMLCQIPGISNATAKRIIDKYGHISELIMKIKTSPIDVDIHGKKFNKNIIKNVNDYLK